MKIIIYKTVLFILPLIILAYGLDSFISETLSRSNRYADGEFSVWNDLLKGVVNSDIILSGASNAYRGLDPAIISNRLNVSSYNLAVNGHNFRLQYLRYRLLTENDNRKPTLIIQAINAVSFEKTRGLYNPDQFLPYMLKKGIFDDALAEYSDYKKIDFYIPTIRYFGKKEALINTLQLLIFPSTNKPYRIKGFRAKDEEWNEDLLKAKAINPSRKFELDTALVSLFKNYIIECKNQNIKLVFVNMPEYIEGQDYISNRAEMMAPFYKFSEDFNIHFFNYLNDSISYDKRNFFNSGHLNKTGAESFTNKLVNDLVGSGVIGN